MSTDLAIGLNEADTATLVALTLRVETAQSMIDTAQAQLTRALADGARLAEFLVAGKTAAVKEREMAHRTVASEFAVALRLADRTVQRKIGDAATLVDDFPATVDAWEAGRIHDGHVHVILHAGGSLPAEQRHDFDVYAVSVAVKTTPGRARPILEHAAERMNPTSTKERHRAAREGRAVCVYPVGDGMSRLIADIPSVLAAGIDDRLTQQTTLLAEAREQAKQRVRAADSGVTAGVAGAAFGPAATAPSQADRDLADDPRTHAQVRADVLTDLLLTSFPDIDPTAGTDGYGELAAVHGRVQVTITATTLAGLDDHPADLAGVGTIDAATARELAGNCAGFDRVFLDPVTGQVTATDRYTPTQAMRRFLRARDRHCRFPGCRVPAARCEHDHTVDHALGGPTCLTNLAGLCQRHHTMKQFTPWRVRQLGGGVLEWTSPTGRVYTDEPPPPLVFFTPTTGTPPPPPF